MRRFAVASALYALLALALSPAHAAPPTERIELRPIGTYAANVENRLSAAEIAAYDHVSQRLYIVNAAALTVDVVSIADPANPTLLFDIRIGALGDRFGAANSVAVHNGLVAVAVEAAVKTDPGYVLLFDRDGRLLNSLQVGALPDMLTWTPNGRQIVVANEGEPNAPYTIDPEGSISIITATGNPARLTQADVITVGFVDFNVGGPRHGELDPRIRIFGPNASVAQDLEPEYIAVTDDSQTAYVTLQENNALAVIDLRRAAVRSLVALGSKDHALPGNALDASDRDGRINIVNWPVRGLYQPDAIDTFKTRGRTFVVTANEGDARDYAGFSEETRVSQLTLNPASFPNAAALRNNAALGRLRVTNATGDLDRNGAFEELYSFGARSFSIWSDSGELIYDSSDDFERITAAAYPTFFNASNTNNTFDDRSDDKGPEPEAVVTGRIANRTYAFIGLERIGGVMVYDVSDPSAPSFVQYVNNRDFTQPVASPDARDLGPEGVLFIPASKSPNKLPLLVVSNEISGTTTIYAILSAR